MPARIPAFNVNVWLSKSALKAFSMPWKVMLVVARLNVLPGRGPVARIPPPVVSGFTTVRKPVPSSTASPPERSVPPSTVPLMLPPSLKTKPSLATSAPVKFSKPENETGARYLMPLTLKATWSIEPALAPVMVQVAS